MSGLLGPTYSQRDARLRPGDIDDCWVVAGIQAASSVGGSYPAGVDIYGKWVPTIPEYRAKAARPDVQGVSNGGTWADILRGARGIYPHLQIVQASTSWTTFVHQVKDLGWNAALAVRASYLPPQFQYGFGGLHEVAVRWNGSSFDMSNPLAPAGSLPVKISEWWLQRAAKAFNGGSISGVLFKPALPTNAPNQPAPTPPPPAVPPKIYTQAQYDAALLAAYGKGVADTKAKAHITYS